MIIYVVYGNKTYGFLYESSNISISLNHILFFKTEDVLLNRKEKRVRSQLLYWYLKTFEQLHNEYFLRNFFNELHRKPQPFTYRNVVSLFRYLSLEQVFVFLYYSNS